MKAHGESALVFVLRVWVKSDDYWDLYFVCRGGKENV